MRQENLVKNRAEKKQQDYTGLHFQNILTDACGTDGAHKRPAVIVGTKMFIFVNLLCLLILSVRFILLKNLSSNLVITVFIM